MRKIAYIFDIDGTLALHTSRGPFEFNKVLTDTPNLPVVWTLNALNKTNLYSIILMSGRPDTCREDTEQWLEKYSIRYTELFMRPAARMYDPDVDIKRDLYYAYVHDNYEIIAIFDDRNSVVDMWRNLGLPCFQVAPGDF